MTALRLQKWLSQLGVASRKETERLVESGRISVNGKIITKLGLTVDPGVDSICLDNEPLVSERPSLGYWMLCKPEGVITSRVDFRGRPTIYDLKSIKGLNSSVFPVGRLDFRTEGLLLLTNDGEMVHRLTHPDYKIPRHYYALVEERLSPSQESKIRLGVQIQDSMSLPAELQPVEKPVVGPGAWYHITVYEGRNRIVRRLFKAVGHEVKRLIRFGYGEIRLPQDLSPGEIRPLHQREIVHLKILTRLS